MDHASRTEKLLLDFLAANPSPTGDDFAALVAQNPAIRDELSAAIERWSRGQDALHQQAFALSASDSDDPGGVTGAGPTATGFVHETPFTADLRSRLSHRGDRKQRYVEAAEIARGGMGRILRAFDADLRRPIALKILRDEISGEDISMAERREARFVEEAQVTAQLDHPGIVPVHDLGVDDRGRIFFTLKLVKGKTLSEVLEEHASGVGSWNTTRIVSVLLQVCEAMAYAHQKQVIHRDLKPSNVMVGRFGEVFVMDFGLARVLGQDDTHDIRVRRDSTATVVISERAQLSGEHRDSPLITMDGDVVGTPAYMAPEQARGEIDAVGPHADVYGIGAMLYHLIAGAPPYSDRKYRDALHLLDLVIGGPPTRLSSVAPGAPSELLSICARAMAREAPDRYPDMRALAEDLRAYLENRVVQAHKIGAVAELRMWVRRNRTLAAACFAIVALVVLGSGGWVWLVTDRNAKLARASAERLEALDIMTARDLLRDEDSHTPDRDGVRRMERFLAAVDDLLGRRSRYEATVRSDAGVLEKDVLRDLTGLLRDIDALADMRSRVRARLDDANALSALSLVDNADAWRIARERIRANVLYNGLDLAPQIGLVPLREHPETHLWEFWHVLSGARPDKDAPAAESGMVLVLLPGGSARIGSPPDEPDRDEDEPAHTVVIPPFFLCRCEVTQAQYIRIGLGNPSHYQPGDERGGVVVTPRHPLESVDTDEAEHLARLWDLRLPTEAEWEYAYRAGADSAYPNGDTADSVEGWENVGDASFVAVGGVEAGSAPWNDRYPVHAPVGSLKANRLGLFDLGGNVSEWTSTRYDRGYGIADPTGSGGARPEQRRVARGGNHYLPPTFARTASRYPYPPDNAEVTIGVRLARSIDVE